MALGSIAGKALRRSRIAQAAIAGQRFGQYVDNRVGISDYVADKVFKLLNPHDPRSRGTAIYKYGDVTITGKGHTPRTTTQIGTWGPDINPLPYSKQRPTVGPLYNVPNMGPPPNAPRPQPKPISQPLPTLQRPNPATRHNPIRRHKPGSASPPPHRRHRPQRHHGQFGNRPGQHNLLRQLGQQLTAPPAQPNLLRQLGNRLSQTPGPINRPLQGNFGQTRAPFSGPQRFGPKPGSNNLLNQLGKSLMQSR